MKYYSTSARLDLVKFVGFKAETEIDDHIYEGLFPTVRLHLELIVKEKEKEFEGVEEQYQAKFKEYFKLRVAQGTYGYYRDSAAKRAERVDRLFKLLNPTGSTNAAPSSLPAR